MKLWKQLRERMMRYPERTVKEGKASMTYEELVIFAEASAERFPKVPCMGIFCESELASAIGVLACFAAGIPVIPLPRRYGKEPCLKIIERAQIPMVFTDNGSAFRLVKLPSEGPKRIPDGVAAILFTSGSTGAPKGAMLTDDNLLANVESICDYYPVCDRDKVLIARTLYHSSALTCDLLASLWKGADIVFAPGQFQPLQILRLMQDEGITAFGSTPSLVATLAAFSHRFTNEVRLLSVSGECMTEGAAKKIRNGFPDADVYCGYGLTEASPRVAYLPANLFDIRPTATGIAVRGVRCALVDESGKEITTPNLLGELIVQGKNVMLKYYDDAKQTRAKKKNGWLYTGDIARIDENGILYVVGRKDGMIIRGGMNIYPAEIENALSADPRVTEVLAYGYSENNTQGIGLQISGQFESQSDVATLCKELLPPYQLPSKIELLDHLDHGVTGKKKRRITNDADGM